MMTIDPPRHMKERAIFNSPMAAVHRQPGRVKVCLALIALQTIIRIWLLMGTSYWQDDFAYLQSARQQGLTVEFLFQPYNGHMMPAGFVLAWLASHLPGSYLPAAAMTIIGQLVASALLLALLIRVVPRGSSIVLAFSVYLFTPLALTSALWWASATQAIPLQIAMFGSACAAFRYKDTKRSVWLVAALAWLILGLAFWEKAILVAPFVALTFAAAEDGRPWARIVTTAREWRLWLSMAIVVGGYLAWYLSLSIVGNAHVESVQAFLRLARLTLVDLVLVGIVGGPWTDEGLYGTAYPVPSVGVRLICFQVLVAIVALGFAQRGKSALTPWMFAGVYIALELAMTAWGRGYWGDFVGLDPRYVADAIPVICIAIALTLKPPPTPARSGPIVTFLHRNSNIVIAVLTIIFTNSALVTNFALSSKMQHTFVSEYVSAARVGLSRDPGAVLYDGLVPGDIMVPAFGPERARVSTVLAAYDLNPTYDIPTENLSILNDQGQVVPVALAYGETKTFTQTPNCGIPLSAGESRTVTLGNVLDAGRWVMRVDYFTSGSGSMAASLGDARFDFAASPGLHSVHGVVDARSDQVTISNVSVDGLVCIPQVIVGYPLPDTP